MLTDYSDITDKLGEPLWWDENGVPRYFDFSPYVCGVYNKYVALMTVECQCCGKPFKVVTSLNSHRTVSYPDPSKEDPEEAAGGFLYGDPPRHDYFMKDCIKGINSISGCTGDSMQTIPVAITNSGKCQRTLSL